MLGQLIEKSKQASCNYGCLHQFSYEGFIVSINFSYYLSDHQIITNIYNQQHSYLHNSISSFPLQLTNMTARNYHGSSLTVIMVKTVMGKVVGELSMRNLTAAIRQYCLQQGQGQGEMKDRLLTFFLACESKLRRNTQQEWNRAIEHELRRMVGVEKLANFARVNTCKTALTILKGLETSEACALDAQLGQMEISQEVHLKTKYFCGWVEFLMERREMRRLKNKEVEDIKKAKLFSQYSLKFQTFLQWKQQTRKAHQDRARAQLITEAASKRAKVAAFVAFKEKIDILGIQDQLAEAVRGKLRNLQIKSVFIKLRAKRQQERSWQGQVKIANNIWLFRFYRFVTNKCTPLLTLSASRNRERYQQNYQRLTLDLCWKGLKVQLQQTRNKQEQIRKIRRGNAINDFKVIQSTKKEMKKDRHQLILLKKSLLLRELIENIEAGSQHSQQYAQKINATKFKQKENLGKEFFELFKQKINSKKHIKSYLISLGQRSMTIRKHEVFRLLSVFRAKRGDTAAKQSRAAISIAWNLFVFRNQVFRTQQKELKQLHQSLSRHRNNQLMKLAFKGFSLYKTVTLNQHQALSTLLSSMHRKHLTQTFQQLRERAQLGAKLQRLMIRSEWVVLKVSFVTILSRMLSSKMKIKAFFQQQEEKLKGKLFQMLKGNSQFMQNQREQVQKIAIKYAKQRFVANLKKEVQQQRALQKVERVHEQANKHHFFTEFKERMIRKQQIIAQTDKTRAMLLASRMIDFMSSAKDFLQYRENEAKLTYKLQKALVRNVFKGIRKRVIQRKQEMEDFQYLRKEHQTKIRVIQNQMAGKYLLGLIRSKPSTLLQKQTQVKKLRVKHVIDILGTYQKEISIKKGLLCQKKFQFIQLLRKKLTLSKSVKKFCRKINRQKAKASLTIMHQNTAEDIAECEQKSVYLSQRLEESRTFAAKQSMISRLITSYDLKQNSSILMNTLLINGFQRLLRQHLSKRAQNIKDTIALRLYASNLKRRALRGLRRATDDEVLKENRAQTEHYSKLSMQKSMEHVRRKSKLMQTIERYNHSRISRVVR